MRSKSPTLADIMIPENNNFGAIRLAMALAVLVSHSYWLVTGHMSSEPLYHWTGHSLGEHAVQVFFFLSGVVVAKSLFTSRSLVDYVTARVLRIVPALIVCVLLTALVLGPMISHLSPAEYFQDRSVLAYILKTASLSTGSAPLPGVFTTNPAPNLVNLSLWTLKYEVICYALLAAFGMAYIHIPRFRAHLTAALALGVALVFVGAPKPLETYTAIDNVRYFVLFFATGTLAYLLRDKLVLNWLLLAPLFLVFTAAIGTRFAELSTALFLGYATLLAASLPLHRVRRLTNADDYSYGVYIIACPVQQALIHQTPGLEPLLQAAIALGFVAPLAILSWSLVERPVMARRHTVAASVQAALARFRTPAPARA